MQQPGAPLPFATCENFRELGGYKGLNGKHVKRGVFYRTPALRPINSEADVALFRSLGIKTILDLRSVEERDAAPDPVFEGITNLQIPAMRTEDGGDVRFDLEGIFAGQQHSIDEMMQVVSESYRTMPFNNPAYQAMFRCMLRGEVPLLFHCTAGKDRTGVAAALILKALGVSREDILTDYLHTNDNRAISRAKFREMLLATLPPQRAEEVANVIAGVDAQNMNNTLDAIDEKYPDYADYLREECGVDAAALAKLQADYLE